MMQDAMMTSECEEVKKEVDLNSEIKIKFIG